MIQNSSWSCLFLSTLFNIFLVRIISDALEEHNGKVSIGDKTMTNLRLADYIDILAEEWRGLEALVQTGLWLRIGCLTNAQVSVF